MRIISFALIPARSSATLPQAIPSNKLNTFNNNLPHFYIYILDKISILVNYPHL